MAKKRKPEDFNYAIGHYWGEDSNEVSFYTYGKEIFYGSMKDAKKFLKYVKDKVPREDWRIFQLIEIPK